MPTRAVHAGFRADHVTCFIRAYIWLISRVGVTQRAPVQTWRVDIVAVDWDVSKTIELQANAMDAVSPKRVQRESGTRHSFELGRRQSS